MAQKGGKKIREEGKQTRRREVAAPYVIYVVNTYHGG